MRPGLLQVAGHHKGVWAGSKRGHPPRFLFSPLPPNPSQTKTSFYSSAPITFT
ncbi:hypothetical protein DL93DRAFT_2080661 [Clavulina sp. PMI_390]|nr:hypothetical protein DL93DRAFT_2080661 [Clavulina sp. PMI_390]